MKFTDENNVGWLDDPPVTDHQSQFVGAQSPDQIPYWYHNLANKNNNFGNVNIKMSNVPGVAVSISYELNYF